LRLSQCTGSLPQLSEQIRNAGVGGRAHGRKPVRNGARVLCRNKDGRGISAVERN
jgi:hypothetical protein